VLSVPCASRAARVYTADENSVFLGRGEGVGGGDDEGEVAEEEVEEEEDEVEENGNATRRTAETEATFGFILLLRLLLVLLPPVLFLKLQKIRRSIGYMKNNERNFSHTEHE
jgi:hypothetical protein